MNVSLRWLRAIAPDLAADPELLARRLTLLGAPVEEIRALSEGIDGIRIAHVLAVRRHPGADRLSVCEVDAGGDTPLQVVCGAPNVQAGGWYPFAPVGAVLPGDFRIREAKIRGERSQGMLCSERELGIGRDQGGLMELRGEFTPGEPFVAALGLDDWRLDVEVTSNRPDLLSHRGIARELAAEGEASLQHPPIPGAPKVEWTLRVGESTVAVPGVQVSVEDPELAPRYLAAVLRGVRVGPSPAWLASRIRAAGGRPINNVVDATNYVLLELGQPLHAFDLGRIRGEGIEVRPARHGERIRTLDDVERALTPGMLCICDAEGPVGLAGIMGGGDSEVSDATTEVLLECALFQPASIRATRRALGISTDASYRFERGIDPEEMEFALRRCIEIILATAGGGLQAEVADVRPRLFARATVPLRPSRVERILGVPFSGVELKALLAPLGFRVSAGSAEGGVEALSVQVPGFRSWDVRREIDLIEEVARRHGYDNFPSELAPFRPGTVPDDPLLRLLDRLRRELVARGFLEAQTLAFAPESEGEIEVLNPLSSEESRLRTSLLPALLRRVSYNFHRGARDIRLFEVGTTFHRSADAPAPAAVASGVPGTTGRRPAGEGALPREELRLAVVLTGGRAPRHWSAPQEPLDLWDVRALLEELAALAVPGEVALIPGGGESALLDPAAAWSVVDAAGRGAGAGGRIRPGTVDSPPWAGPVWAVEFVLPASLAPRPATLFRPLPAHPPVERDLALLLPPGVEAGRVAARIREFAGPLLERVEPFDLYEGPGVPEGFRSVAWRLVFRAADRTLTEGDVLPVIERVLAALREGEGVEQRR